MNKATALVSIYNSEEFIRAKIKNLLEQTVPIKIILIDCTGGRELKLVEDLTNTKQFIKLIYPKRISVWHAINDGIALTRTPYVVQSNTDDLLHPQAFEKQLEKLNAGYDISYFNFKYVNEFQKTWKEANKKGYETYKVPEKYSSGRGLGAFPMWRKSLHEKHGYFKDKLEVFGDALFWDDLSKDSEIKWGKIDEVLGAYAIRQNNLEKNQAFQEQDKDWLKRYHQKKAEGR